MFHHSTRSRRRTLRTRFGCDGATRYRRFEEASMVHGSDIRRTLFYVGVLCAFYLSFFALRGVTVQPSFASWLERNYRFSDSLRTEQDQSAYFWLDEYRRWHALHRHSRGARRLVFTPVKAGLGDNLRGLLRTYLYAVVSRRVFHVDWKLPYPLSSVIATEWYSLDDTLRNAVDNSSVVRFHYNSKLEPPELYELLRGDTAVVYHATGNLPVVHDAVSQLRGHHLLNAHIPPLTEPTLRLAARTLLAPSQSSLSRHRKHLNRMHLCVGSKLSLCPNYNSLGLEARRDASQYIGVHARLGIGTGEHSRPRFRDVRGNLSAIAGCLASAVGDAAKKLGMESPKVLLATDTPPFRAVFKHALRSTLPTARPLSLGGVARHYATIRPGWTIERRHFEHLFDELRLLADAVHIVKFPSSFSKVAYFMGTAIGSTELSLEQCSKHARL